MNAPSFDEIVRLPVLAIADLVRRGEVSAVELAQASLEASRARGLGDGLGAFLTLQDEHALAAAAAIDAARVRGEALGPLAGVPLGVKDVLTTAGAPTTAGSRILTRRGEPDADDGWRPPTDATAVARLRAAGAVLVGKCNCDELAMGSSNENSGFYPARNPWDPTRIPGGSSGGSAVAVAAGLVAGALGTDTGGSIRQPAALTGTVGLKPTYGRVSRRGVVAFASSLDQVGPFASDVTSVAALLQAIAGHDAGDATSSRRPVDDLVEACARGAEGARGLRIGVPEEYFPHRGEGADDDAGIEPEVEEAVRAAIGRLAAAGAEVRPVRLPHTRHALATYYVIATAEASSNLARFDGVRFGFRAEPTGGQGLSAMYRQTRGRGFGDEVRLRILLGTFVLSAGYHDAYYLRAQQVRTLIARDFERAFTEVDVLLAPTSPTVAFPLGARVDDPLAMYRADVLTLPASLAGLPGASVPCGLAPARSERPALPIGLQIIGRPWDEATVLRAARAAEALGPALGRAPAQGAVG